MSVSSSNKKSVLIIFQVTISLLPLPSEKKILWQEYVRLQEKGQLPGILFLIQTLKQAGDFYPIFKKNDIFLLKKINGLL